MPKKRSRKPARRGPYKVLEGQPSGNCEWLIYFYDAAGRRRVFARGVDYSREFADSEAELHVDRFLTKYPDALK